MRSRLSALFGALILAICLSINVSYAMSPPPAEPAEPVKPEIINPKYDAATKKITFKVKPNGHSKIEVYYEDTKKITLTHLGDELKECTITNISPAGINSLYGNSLSIIRNNPANPKEVTIAWTNPEEFREIYLKTVPGIGEEVIESEKYKVNICQLIKNVTAIHEDLTLKEIEKDIGINKNSCKTTIDNLKWNDGIRVQFKYPGGTFNTSPVLSKSNVNDVIYTTHVVNDGYLSTIQVSEGRQIPIDVKINDIHDSAWLTPLIDEVIILKGKGQTELVDASQFSSDYGFNGLVISYTGIEGYIGEKISSVDTALGIDENDFGNGVVILKYKYKKVREDIPAAEGKIKINIKSVNQSPIPYNYQLSETSSWGVYQGNTIINIPWDKITEKCTDRELAEGAKYNLFISRVSNVSSGTISLVPSATTTGKQDVRIDLTDTPLFYGKLDFKYKVSDGENESIDFGVVSINVTKPAQEPLAKDTEVSVQLDEKTKSITLAVENPGNTSYQLDEIKNVRLNGRSLSPSNNTFELTKEVAIGQTGGSIPYVVIKLKDTTSSGLKEGDKITFNYTISYPFGSETRTSTAEVKVSITSADDPNDHEGYLYVHRKPLAFFSPIIKIEAGRVTECTIGSAQEHSYDLDHQFMHSSLYRIEGTGGYSTQTRPYYSWNGLRAWEWGIKTIDGNWTTKVFDVDGVPANSSLTSAKRPGTYDSADKARSEGIRWIQEEVNNKIRLSGNQTIIISLRVRDIDNDNNIGAWSDQTTVTLTSVSMKPVANFRTDNSTYFVPKSGSFNMEIYDQSYDPNGDKLRTWTWTLSDEDGNELQTVTRYSGTDTPASTFASRISSAVRSRSWDKTPKFKITLVVTEDTREALESDPFSFTITVFRNNEQPQVGPGEGTDPGIDTPPDIPPGGGDDPDPDPDPRPSSNPKNNPTWNNKIKNNNAYLFEEDLLKDGVKGDTKGTASSPYLGKPLWSRFFRIIDDQPTNTADVMWTFTGNAVKQRMLWSDMNAILYQKVYNKIPGLYSSGYPIPAFDNTVTDQGFKPGAYKIVAAITDHPTGAEYAEGSSKTSYYETHGDQKPYHMYVVPSLEIQTTIEVNDWKLSWDGNNYVNTSGSYDCNTYSSVDNSLDNYYNKITNSSVSSSQRYFNTNWNWTRITDNATLTEAGVEIEDVVPTLGDPIKIKSKTNKYVTNLYAQLPCAILHPDDANEHIDGRPITTINGRTYEILEMENKGLDVTGDYINWETEFILEDIADPRNEDYGYDLTMLMIRMYGVTNYGSETSYFITRDKTVPVPLWVLPVKLYDFRITEITDPNLSDKFNAYLSGLIAKGEQLDNEEITNGVLVHHLALDSRAMAGNTETPEMTKGYSFYFEVNSKGMKKPTDQVKIIPRIYQMVDDGANLTIGKQLIGYVPGQTGKYEPYMSTDPLNFTPSQYIKDTYGLYYEGAKKHSLNDHNMIVIGTDLRVGEDQTEQIWYGRYGIPSDAKFFAYDETNLTSETEWNGKILVTFELSAYKKNQARYNYIEKKQWWKEREKFDDAEDWKATYASWDLWDGTNKGYLNISATKTNRYNPVGRWQGAVIVYNTSKSLKDDYTSNPIWRE